MKVLLPKKVAEASERTRKDVNIVLMSISIFLGNIHAISNFFYLYPMDERPFLLFHKRLRCSCFYSINY